MRSDLFKLNWRDVINGLVMFVGSAVLTAILTAIQDGGDINWNAVGNVALIATIIYLLKNIFTDNSGKLLSKF